jgi:putative endonuclease
MKQPAVYMLASQRNGTLYIGVTSDLIQRVWQHKEGLAEGFTKQHDVKILVWYEQHETMESAISKEKANPEWNDLWPEITGAVIPANAGTQQDKNAFELKPLDSRLRGNDEVEV